MRRGAFALGLVALTVGACGGGSSGPKAAPPTTLSPAQQQAAVTTTWTSFFNAKTPTAQREALLQDGANLDQQMAALGKLTPADLTAKVDSVTVNGTQANVTYELISHGQSLLGHPSTGTAVMVNGQWEVSRPTFCALAGLAGKPCPTT
jgi:hypothetical protein